MSIKVVYHSADFDGICSAAIIKHTHNMNSENVECYGINHGEPFPWDDIGRDDLVYMVDFGLQPFSDMVLLNGITNLIWIDHHKSALVDYDKAMIPFKGLRSLDLAGCQLTWDYFYRDGKPENDYERPPIIDLLGWYDIWQHDKMRNVVEFQYGLKSYKLTPESDIWGDLFLACDGDNIIEDIMDKGKTILSYKRLTDIKKMKDSFETKIRGYNVLAHNSLGTSDMFESVINEKHDFMFTFGMTKNGNWNCGMYTDKDHKDLDLGQLANSLANMDSGDGTGGGHPKAAGMQLKELPFELED